MLCQVFEVISLLYFNRCTVKEMTAYEKDLLLLGMVASSIDDSPKTSGAKTKQKARVNARMRGYYYGHKEVCLETFLFLMDIYKSKLTAVKQHFRDHGLVPRKSKAGKYCYLCEHM